MRPIKILLALGFLLMVENAVAQVAVIANKDVPLDSLSKTQLRDFYSCEMKQWNKQVAVTVVDLKLSSAAKDVFYKFLGMTASRMKSLWLKKMLMGESSEPLAAKSEEEMVRKVASTSGALGFVSLNKITPEVKTLMIISSSEPQP